MSDYKKVDGKRQKSSKSKDRNIQNARKAKHKGQGR